MEYIAIDPREKKICMNRYLQKQKGYRRKYTLGIVFCAFALALVFVLTALFAARGKAADADGDIPVSVIGFLCGLAVGVAPFLIGRSMIAKATKKYGFPFTERSNEILRYDATSLQFAYHPTTVLGFNGMNLYQIRYADIRSILFDEATKVLSLVGKGEIVAYDDLLMTVPSKDFSGKRFYDNTEYQIMLATEKSQQIVALWREKTIGGS